MPEASKVKKFRRRTSSSRTKQTTKARQPKHKTKDLVNAINILFYAPGTDPGGSYTAGMTEWAPNGKWEDADNIADELKQKLHLHVKPLKIECYDISNLGGQLAVGSMVSFKEGEPLKDHYRRFKIRTVKGADDCRMLYEVLRRRFSNGGGGGIPFPDLVVVDGGKGQLKVVVRALQELN